MNTSDKAEGREIDKYGHLNYVSSLSKSLLHFNPKDIAVHGLTAMIKVVAQMKNLRRGHTAQGLVKKIEVDQTYEGYANFMAPGRMQMIAHDVKNAAADLQAFQDCRKQDAERSKSMKKDEKEAFEEKLEARGRVLKQRVEDAAKVFNEDILKPKTDTYLTAEWDEMIPFPTSKHPFS